MESLIGSLFNMVGEAKDKTMSELEYKSVVYARKDWVKGKEITSAYVDNKGCLACICSLCYGFNLNDMISYDQQKHLRNYKNAHCILCTCEGCICDKGKEDKRFSDEPILPTGQCEENGRICRTCKERKGKGNKGRKKK